MQRSDEELLALASNGDEDAVNELLLRHGPQVRRRLQIGPQWQAALDLDDIMQITYLEVFLRIDGFVPEGPGAFPAWLLSIAENNLRDALRGLERAKRPSPRRRIRPAAGEDSFAALSELLGWTATTPSRQTARAETQAALEKAIAALPEIYRQVVRLFDLEGRSAADIAAILGRSRPAIYMLRARAHDRLREILGSGSRFFSRT